MTYKYDEENESNPLLRYTFCPWSEDMPQDQALNRFFSDVRKAESLDEIYVAYRQYAESNGCYSNMTMDVIEKLKEFGLLQSEVA